MTPTTALAPYREDQEVIDAQSRAQTVADAARALDVKDEASNAQALEMLATCRKATKRFEELKKRWLDPLNAQIKQIRADMDEMAAPAKEADGILAQKVSVYRAKAQEAARKEQERLRLLQEKRQAAAAAKAEAKGLEAPPVMPIVPTVAAPAKTVDAGDSRVTFVDQYHFEITDANAVPKEWCCPDEKRIGIAVRGQILTADNAPAGIRIWKTSEPRVR